MKKDTYPDIRIEVLSEGLAKKILGKVEDAPPSVYGEEKPTSATIPDINAKGVNREMAKILETSNKKPNYTAIVKEAILELRKAPDTAYDPMGGVSGTKSRKTKDVLATPGPATSVYEEAQMAGIDPTGARRPEREDPKGRADVKAALASADAPMTSRENVYQEAQEAGLTPYGPYETFGGGTAAPTGEEAPFGSGSPYSRTAEGLGSGTTESIDYRPQDKKTTAKTPDVASISDISARTGTGRVSGTRDPKGFDASAVSALAAREAAAPTGGAGKKEEKEPATSMPTLVGGPDVDEDVLEGRSGTLPPDESTSEPEEGGPGTDEVVVEEPSVTEEPSVEEVSGKVAADVTGIDPTIIDEIEKPVGQISSEITRPNNPTDSSKKLPQFGSSGYFSAVLQIGEEGTIERDGEQVSLSEVNYGVKDLAEFLELYPQNETFDRDKFLDTLTEKSITKAQNPKSITAKPTGNVNGVNVSTPVVTGAGTMKTLEKTGKGLNKPKASGTPRKTRAKKINPKTVEAAVMKSERPAMDNTLRYIIKEAIEEIKIEKAPKRGRNLPSKARQFKETDLGRGAFTNIPEERKKTRRDIGSRMGPQRKETGKATGGSAEGYRGYISNMAKAALEKQEGDVDTFSSRRLNYSDPSKPDTRMSDTGPDEYGDPNKYIPTPMRDVGPQEVSAPKLNKRPEVYRGQ